MKYYKDMPIGLWIIAITIIISELYYYFPVYTGSGRTDLFTINGWTLFVWFSIFLSIILIFAVTYGFYKANKWARLYVIIMTSISAFWSMYFIVTLSLWMGYGILIRYLYLVFYVIIITYLMMSKIREYFGVKKLFI